MKKIKIKQVDAFTRIPFSGNPAGVVTAASGLSKKQMLNIAREMNLSETIFFLPPTSLEADLSVKWFTPTVEVDICGHATVAGFYALAEEKKYGMKKSGNYKFKVQTNKGIVDVNVKISAKGDVKVIFSIPIPVFSKFEIDKNILMEIFNSSENIFNDSLPIMKSDYHIVIPVKGLESLFDIKPDFLKILEFGKKNNLKLFSLLSLETIDKNSSMHLRCFVPSLGINEDPVTGLAQGEIGVYMVKNELVEGKNGKYSFIGEQGDCMNRAGRVEVSVIEKNKNVNSLSITGTAVTVVEGNMYL